MLTKKVKSIAQSQVNQEQPSVGREYILRENDEDNIPPKRSKVSLLDKPKEYAASGLKHTLHGNIYQLKLLMLFLKRGLKNRYTFLLATEMDAAEKFDDLVFQYENNRKDKIVYRSLQAKHKQDETKKITSDDLLTETKSRDEFSLLKYFISYRKIKQNTEFKGELKDFILCTNINLDFDELQEKQIKTELITEDDAFLEVKTQGKKSARYKFIVNKQHNLYGKLRETSDIHRLAKKLVENISSDKYIDLKIDIFKFYHMALAKEVIDIENINFHNNFANNQVLSESTGVFREIFLKEILKIKGLPEEYADKDAIWREIKSKELKLSSTFGKGFKLDTNPQLVNIEQFVQEIAVLISSNLSQEKIIKVEKRKGIIKSNVDKLAGHILVEKNKEILFRSTFLNDSNKLPGDLEQFKSRLKTELKSKGINFSKLDQYKFKISDFKTCEEEQLHPSLTLPNDNIADIEIDTFLNDLVFAVDQPNEIELGKIIAEEIGEEFNLIDSDFVTDNFQKEVLNWMKEKQGKYLSENNVNAFFNEGKRKIAKLVLVGPTSEYCKKIRELGIVFNNIPGKLESFLTSSTKQIFNLITSQTTKLGAIKVDQALQTLQKNTTSYKQYDSYVFIRLSSLLCLKDHVVKAFGPKERSNNLLIIECKLAKEIAEKDVEALYNQLSKIIRSKHNKKVIFITQQNDLLGSKFKTHSKYDEEVDTSSFIGLMPDSQNKLLERKVIFQGEKNSLNKLIDENSKELVDLETLVKFIGNDEITIGNKLMNLGEISYYYIDRTFNYQIEIKTEVFKARESTDLFAISGIDKIALSRLVSERSKIRLFEENDPDKSSPIRFFILDNQKAEEQFNKLIQKEHYRNYSIHWLKKEESGIFWQKSKGDISGLHQYIEVDGSHAKHYSEADLLNQDNQHKILIVSDTAGMGKSTVLTDLSEKIKKEFPYLWVVRVDLNDYTKVLNEELEHRKFNKPSFNRANSNEAINFLLDKMLESSEQLKLKTSLEKELFRRSFKHQGKIAVLFDGFDEISPDYKEVVIDLLRSLINTKVEKLWVTTRPHMRAVLEDKLGVFAYTLKPFSEENQIEFLTKFWQKRLELTDDKRLKIYAEKLIKQLAKSISDKEKEFTGIPLQTRMLAGAFEENFKQFYHSNKVEPEFTEKLDLISLYQRFINNKFDIYQKEKSKDNDSNISANSKHKYFLKYVLKYHQQLALQVLFSKEQVNLLQDKQLQADKYMKKELPKIGIVQITSDELHFIHRTFAEYFAANFLASQLAVNWKDQKVQKFLLTDILIKSDYQVIRAFLNGQLAKEQLSQSALTHYGKQIDKLWSAQNNLRNKHGHTILHIASIEANTKIINFLLDSLRKYSETLKSLVQDYNYYNKQTALHLAANFCHLEIVKSLVERGANVNANDQYRNTVLHMAANKGNLHVIKWLVGHGADVKATDNDGCTVLHRTAEFDNLDVVKWLVEHGADVNATGKHGYTVLHRAADGGSWVVVQWLVEHSADVNATDQDGYTVLHIAAGKGNFDVVKWLVGHCADVTATAKDGWTVLHRAAEFDYWDVVQWLVEHGAYVNATGKYGYTVLRRAAGKGNLDVAKWLVEHGADVNAKDKYGYTVLHLAAESGNLYAVKWLVEHGADISATANDGWIVLHQAAEFGNWDVVQWLVEHGADVKVTAKDGYTVLHRPVESGNWDMVKWLVEHGADVNAKSSWRGDMVLHSAASSGNLDVVQWLVEHGADVKAKSSWLCNTVLHSAAKAGNLDLVQWLVEHSADVKAKSCWRGNTVLHWAAEGGKLDVVKWLVENGNADVNAKSKNDWTVLHGAAVEGNWDVVKWLVQHGADVNAKDKCGYTVLHSAAFSGHLAVVQWLVAKKGADVMAADNFGRTPLARAAESGRLDVVKFLIEKEADVNALDEND